MLQFAAAVDQDDGCPWQQHTRCRISRCVGVTLGHAGAPPRAGLLLTVRGEPRRVVVVRGTSGHAADCDALGRSEVQNRLALRPNETLVELGCGRAGYGLTCITSSRSLLVGVDVSGVALRAAGRSAERRGVSDRGVFVTADLADTGLREGCADAVLAVDAFHFAASIPAATAELVRLLRPGGRVVMTRWEALSAAAAQRLPERIARMSIERDLCDAGLVDVRVEERPEWSRAEKELWVAAAQLDVGDDPALAELREQAREFLPIADSLRRVLVFAGANRLTRTACCVAAVVCRPFTGHSLRIPDRIMLGGSGPQPAGP